MKLEYFTVTYSLIPMYLTAIVLNFINFISIWILRFFFSLSALITEFIKKNSQGFPAAFNQWDGGGVSAKMPKNCMKIAKSTILEQNSMEGMRRQVNFSSSGEIPPFFPPPGATLSQSQIF